MLAWMWLEGWSLFELTLESYLRDMMAVAEASSGYHKTVRTSRQYSLLLNYGGCVDEEESLRLCTFPELQARVHPRRSR
jgi:hypothetical protein